MRKRKSLQFERLENRRLLAADLGYDVMHACDCDVQPEACIVAPSIGDGDADELFVDPEAPTDGGPEATMDSAATAILNLEDGTDGYFGSLDSESPTSTFDFTTSENGLVDIVIATSFDEASTNLQVHDADGNLVTASEADGLEGFQTLTFAADAGQSYQLAVSSEDGGQGDFQVTVGFQPDTVVSDDVEASDSEDCQDEVVDVLPDDVIECDFDAEQEDAGDDSDIVDDGPTSEDDCVDDVDEEPVEEEPVDDGEVTDEPTDEGPTDEADEDSDDLVTDDGDDLIDEDVDDPIIDDGGLEPEDCEDESESNPDLHVNVIGPDATPLTFADGVAQINGELEAVDDVDVFKLIAPDSGEITIFAGESSSENVDLDINVFDSTGALIVDGATNEVVKISFEAEAGVEYFVTIESGQDQTGSYSILAESIPAADPAPTDDHANEVGEHATEISMDNGTGKIEGELETATDIDAFRFVTGGVGEVVISVDVDSLNHEADAQLMVFEGDELVAEGTTNESLGLRFDAAANTEYQVVVDATNDVPMTYQMTASEFLDSLAPQAESDTQLTDSEIEAAPVAADAFESEEMSASDRFFADLNNQDVAADALDELSSEADQLLDSDGFQWAFAFNGDRSFSRFNRG